MKLAPLSTGLQVTAQLQPTDVVALKQNGIASVVCNRPDGEQPDQPDHARLQAACQQAGLQFAYLPVVPGALSDADAQAFAAVLDQLPSPVVAYCRTGTRSASLWALAQVQQAGAAPEEVLSVTADAGYDLSGLAARLRNAHPATP